MTRHAQPDRRGPPERRCPRRSHRAPDPPVRRRAALRQGRVIEIGRASCRERV